MVMALSDIVRKAANVAQLLGLDVVTLIIVAMSFLRFHQARKECRKLEARVRMLGLLLTSCGGRLITQQQQQNDDLELVAGQLQAASVLREASDLVESYKRSSLYARIRGARGMATRFRDLRSRVDYCYYLILAINARLLVEQVQPPNQLNHPPPSLVVRAERNDDDDDVGVPPPSAGDSVHAAAEPSSSSTTAPDGTHVIDITPARQE